jgi:hypothetical protein
LKAKGLSVTLSTNGLTHKPEWWKKLREVSDSTDQIRFAIDGIEQSTYEMYRVGGSLSKVLRNHTSFKGRGNDWLQYIYFEHNRHEDISGLVSLFQGRVKTLTSSYAEGKYFDSATTQVKPRKEFIVKFKALDNLFKYKKDFHIKCVSELNQEHFIDHKGRTYPCCFWADERGSDTWDLKYSFKHHDFCKRVCDKFSTQLREAWQVEL